MAFLELKPTDVISTVYVAYPSYSYRMVSGTSGPIYLFPSGSVGVARSYEDVNGFPMSGGFQITGTVKYILNSSLTEAQKRSISRVRNIYASSSFEKPQNYNSSSIFSNTNPSNQTMVAILVPSILYGTEFKPGSVSLMASSSALNSAPWEAVDDGYGGLYSNGVLIGSILYQHGTIILGQNTTNISTLVDMTVQFSGTNKVPSNIYLCRAPRSSLNFSNNPSFSTYLTSSNSYEITTRQPKTLITGVALYDENYELVGVAKVSSPILNDEANSILFKLKLNF